jgi:hypothetical protein
MEWAHEVRRVAMARLAGNPADASPGTPTLAKDCGCPLHLADRPFVSSSARSAGRDQNGE